MREAEQLKADNTALRSTLQLFPRGDASPMQRLYEKYQADLAELQLVLPHLRRDWAHRCHICAGTGLTAATSAPGLATTVLSVGRCAHCRPVPQQGSPALGGALLSGWMCFTRTVPRRCRRRPSCRWSMRRSAMLAWSRTYAVLCAHLRLGLRDCTRLGFRDGAYSSRGRSQRGHSRSPPAACAAPQLRRVALAAIRVQRTT